MFDYLANPTRFLKIASYAEPVAWGVFALAGLTGLGLAFVGSPADYQQGEFGIPWDHLLSDQEWAAKCDARVRRQ